MSEDLDLYEALLMASCPHYRDEGTCHAGCWTEPNCQVNEPDTPWLDIISMWAPMAHELPE